MKSFKSKIGLELVIPIGAILTFVCAIMAIKGLYPVMAFILFLAFLIGKLFTGIEYIIDGDELIIKSSFLFTSKIAISSIKSVAKSRNPLSAPAASLDRLEIKYGKYDYALVSPKNKIEFINELLARNPNIENNVK